MTARFTDRDPQWEAWCPSCAHSADHVDHLTVRFTIRTPTGDHDVRCACRRCRLRPPK